MQKVRVGVIGLGWVSQVFHLPFLCKNPDVEVIAVCDKDKARTRWIGDKFSIALAFTDYQQLIDRDDIDAVLIATTTDAHHGITLRSVECGKHVFVEKPIARRHSEAKEMTEAAQKAKRLLMVGMNNRFRPDRVVVLHRSIWRRGSLRAPRAQRRRSPPCTTLRLWVRRRSTSRGP